MRIFSRLVDRLVVLGGLCCGAVGVLGAEAGFEFGVERAGLTSAGVYTEEGRLVRVLWEMKEFPAGKQRGTWDGKDQKGMEAAAGKYVFKVVVNPGTYANVGAIGNSGMPGEKEHTPTNIESVAVDEAGNIYTANGWDEAGADFKSWDAAGKSRFDAKYQIRNGRPNGAPYAIAVDDQYIYCACGGWEREPWKNRQQIQRFRLADGKHVAFTGKTEKPSADEPKGGEKRPRIPKGPSDILVDGHIQVYEWPKLLIGPNTREEEAKVMASPLRGLAVRGETIYACDALAGKIRMYHKETGAATGEFAVTLPQAVAIDATGNIWVAHQQSRVSMFRGDGYCAGSYGPLGRVTSLCFGPEGALYASDAEAGQVFRMRPGQPNAKFEPVLGVKARAGDRAADRFFALRGVAVDGKGNLVTIQREPGASGARLARWTGQGRLLWEQFATEFVSLGNYGAADPDLLYTMTFHAHRLMDRAKGTWDYAACMADESAERYRSHPHGVIRVMRLGKSDFVFLPMGDGVQVYRVEGGAMKLAALVGGHDPDPSGEKRTTPQSKWSWSDQEGQGKPDPAKIARIQGNAGNYACFGMDVDDKGGIWFANTASKSIWHLPLHGLDGRGNPMHDWSEVREVVGRDNSELKFEPNMAQGGPDGSVYAFGWSTVGPQPKNNPFWMGGKTLCRFDAKGNRLWAVELPAACVGLDVIRSGAGGCMVGSAKDAEILHYSPDGLLIGRVKPGEAMGKQSGWMDNHASVAVNRDPRDGVLDVFAEDDYVCRIGWYRVDDRGVKVVTGEITRP